MNNSAVSNKLLLSILFVSIHVTSTVTVVKWIAAVKYIVAFDNYKSHRGGEITKWAVIAH